MIPVCEPTLKGNEIKYVTDAIKSNWISSSGKYIEKFEQGFSEYCGVRHGVSCCNGTAAIHLALEALGIGRGDEVVVPTFSMIATANAVVYSGARPVLVDSELDTWNIDPNSIEEKITKRTKAIMVVHTYGHPADMDRVNKIADEHGIAVIEDAAEAHGAEYKGKKAGSLSDVACFSFYANKIITTGEGGMLVTDDKKTADRAKYLRNHAFTEKRFLHKDLGFNYRFTNLQAAVGLAQLERIDDLVNARINNAHLYNRLLGHVRGVQTPPCAYWAKNVYWMYSILIGKEFGLSRDMVMARLQEKGVETRPFFVPMHRQPVYRKKDERFPSMTGNYKNADYLAKHGLYLPSSSSLSKNTIEEVCKTLISLKG